MRIVTLLALCTVLCCAQGHKQEECLNLHITPPMIKDMMEISELIHKSLPRDNAPFQRILGKLKKLVGPNIQETCRKKMCVLTLFVFHMQLQPKGLFKAQIEFRSVLVWISNAMDKSRTHEIH
uniref:Interleukin 26 n=1 Tax=Sinocyclocheilus rhinocerous TaxID=307959 RepID=A0A673HFM0_9TELE